MKSSLISEPALKVIDSYTHFKVGAAVSSVPYFNNKTIRRRGALPVFGGKGTAHDLSEEVTILIVKNHIDANSLADESLKQLMVDNNLGIECSGLAYRILEAENAARGFGSLARHISFVNCHGLWGAVRARLRPALNCDVATFAASANSRPVPLSGVAPGDLITMTNDQEESERDHILVVHEVSHEENGATTLHYTHAARYPEDGLYSHGLKQGMITVRTTDQSLTTALWNENGKDGEENRLYRRAQKSKTEVRRLGWW